MHFYILFLITDSLTRLKTPRTSQAFNKQVTLTATIPAHVSISIKFYFLFSFEFPIFFLSTKTLTNKYKYIIKTYVLCTLQQANAYKLII